MDTRLEDICEHRVLSGVGMVKRWNRVVWRSSISQRLSCSVFLRFSRLRFVSSFCQRRHSLSPPVARYQHNLTPQVRLHRDPAVRPDVV
ncbi:hypothetical protein SRHO_G00049600 [Serrasalmus rhombeus]